MGELEELGAILSGPGSSGVELPGVEVAPAAVNAGGKPGLEKAKPGVENTGLGKPAEQNRPEWVSEGPPVTGGQITEGLRLFSKATGETKLGEALGLFADVVESRGLVGTGVVSEKGAGAGEGEPGKTVEPEARSEKDKGEYKGEGIEGEEGGGQKQQEEEGEEHLKEPWDDPEEQRKRAEAKAKSAQAAQGLGR